MVASSPVVEVPVNRSPEVQPVEIVPIREAVAPRSVMLLLPIDAWLMPVAEGRLPIVACMA